MVTASKDNYIRIWDYRRKKVIAEINTEQNELKEAFFSPDGKKILSISRYNFKCWDISTLTPLNIFEFNSYVYTNIGFSKDSKKILGESDKAQYMWDIGVAKTTYILDKFRVSTDYLPKKIALDQNAD